MGWIWSSLYSKAILAPVFRYWSELEYLSILSELWELFNLQLVVSRLLKWLSVIFTYIIPSHWVLEDPMTIMTHVITLFYLAKGEPDLIKRAFKKKEISLAIAEEKVHCMKRLIYVFSPMSRYLWGRTNLILVFKIHLIYLICSWLNPAVII